MAEQPNRSTAQRLKDVEGYTIRHGEIIQELLADVDEVKKVLRQNELKDVREEGTWTAVLTQLKSFDQRLGKIEGLGSRALWTFIAAIILAFVTFLVRGGLAP